MTDSYTRYDQKTVYYADNNNGLLEKLDFFYKEKGGGEMIESVMAEMTNE